MENKLFHKKNIFLNGNFIFALSKARDSYIGEAGMGANLI